MRVRRRVPAVVCRPSGRPARAVVRRSAGNWTLQSTLHRHGLGPVAGVDEAGRGACAGPLVVAACVLRPGDARRLDGLTDSKLLTAGGPRGVLRADHPAGRGLRGGRHPAVGGRPPRRARRQHRGDAPGGGRPRRRARLRAHRRVPGARLRPPRARRAEGRPGRGVRRRGVGAGEGDAGPDHGRAGRRSSREYGFAEHKGYCTPVHDAALAAHGPSRVHRYSFVNVRLPPRDRRAGPR